jgi:hypothetical protein
MTALLLAGCRGESSNNANAPAKQAGAAANAAASPVQSETAQATPTLTQTTPAAAPVASEAEGVPVTDAVAFRDRLLEIAQGIKFDAQSSASANGDAIRAAWLRQYPKLKFSIFYSMVADPNAVSASDTFLFSGVPGNFDQLYAFAVSDTKGKCAGGAAVIPGDNVNRKVSNERVPTLFKPIEMSKAKSCTGQDAAENYKP